MADEPPIAHRARPIPGEGNMVRAVNQKDWSHTLLGPREQWPDAIQRAVTLCLNAEFQMGVLAGPELVYIYNDACSVIFGDKHPWALGQRVQDVWPEAWDSLAPLLNGVLATGRPHRTDDLMLVLNRADYWEECHFDASYSPIHDADGAVVGVFLTTVETTKQVVSERRQAWLGALALQVAQHGAAHGSLELLGELFAANPYDLPLAALYLDEGGCARRVFCSGLRTGGARVPERIAWPRPAAGTAAHPLSNVALAGEARLFDAAIMLGEEDRCGAWQERPRQLMAIPLELAGRDTPRGMMVVALSPLVRPDEQYLRFIHTAAGLVATAVASADAREAERRRAETMAELDLSKSQFSALHREVAAIRDDLTHVIEGSGEAFISLDRQLNIRALNAAAARMFGKDRHELVGQPLLAQAPAVAGSQLLAGLRAVASGGPPSVIDHYYAAAERWYEVRILPAPYGVLTFGTDITPRKTAEQAMLEANTTLERRVHERTRELREAHQLLKAVFDRAPGGIAITSVDGEYLRVNPAYASMLGYEEAALAGCSLAQLVDPADYEHAAPALARLLAGDQASCETEMRFRRAGGETIWVLSFLSVIDEGDDQPRCLVHVAKDVTRRRKREAERRAAQDELKSLYLRLETVREMERAALAREVHDQLGQILSAAKIDLRLLEHHMLERRAPPEPGEVVRELRGASATLDRALQIVREIATALRAPELDGQGLYAALEWHAHDFEQRTRIRIALELEAGLPQPGRQVAETLLRIFQEALTNVLRHAHATEVRVTLERRGERLLLRVRDDGHGIAHGRRKGVGSLGITGMRERALLVRGRLLVAPLAPRGTLVSALVPATDPVGSLSGPAMQEAGL